MTIPTNPIEHFSPFLPATYNVPEEEDRLPSYLGEKLSQFSDVINDKKIGIYRPIESRNGEAWFYDTTKFQRFAYNAIARVTSFIPQVIQLPPIISDINPQFIVSHVWGSASKVCSAVGAGDGDYFSFYGQGDSRIQFTMSDLLLTITTDGARAAYQGFIVIEYIRNGT